MGTVYIDGLRGLVAIYEKQPNAGAAAIILQAMAQPDSFADFINSPNTVFPDFADVVNLAAQTLSVLQDAQSQNPAHAYGPFAESVIGAYWVE